MISRYGNPDSSIITGWDHIFNYYYTKSGIFEVNPVIKRPYLVLEDMWPSEDAVKGISSLISDSSSLGRIDSYQFDIVNLFREVFGQYAGHMLYEITIQLPAEEYQ